MEIIHAAYRMHNQNAAFLIRSADFIKDLPPEMTRAFVDTHFLNKAQMKVSLIMLFPLWRHFITMTRILFVLPFIFKFGNPSEV